MFAPVWTTLFAPMGVATWLVWRALSGPNADEARLALGSFAGQFVPNLGRWAAFFGAQSLLGGLVVFAALWLASLATVVAFHRVDVRAAALLVPYLLRVGFAGYLNHAFWALN